MITFCILYFIYEFSRRMVDCLMTEWNTLSSIYNIQAPVTIFFGGGTPSLIDVRLVENIVSHLCKNRQGCIRGFRNHLFMELLNRE